MMSKKINWPVVAIVLLAWIPTLAAPAISAVWNWSETASSNASSDPQINWRENQPPSSVNDSARAMMAALASYRDDISGLLTATGTSTAYLVATNQNLCSSPATVPQDGQQLALTMNLTNGIGATLTADACSTYPIQTSPGVGVGPASLIQGSPYTFRFSVANSAWMLRDFYGSALTVPLGGLVPYTLPTVPNSNFVLPAGQCLSTTTYATYWIALGSPSSGSCSGGQFAIIDLRGTTLVALDNLNGTPANRLTSSTTGCGTAMNSVGATCANGNQSGVLVTQNLPPYTPSGTISNGSVTTPLTEYPALFSGSPTITALAAAQTSTVLNAVGTQGTSTFAGAAQGGSSTPFPNVMPATAVVYLLRVI